jgi:hypothetical protein
MVHANDEQQADMQVSVDAELQKYWKKLEETRKVKKFDDLGDALLHALNELLCGTSNYRPLIPSMPSLHINRSVVIAIMPQYTFWVVLQCNWNVFTLENLGYYQTRLSVSQKYHSMENVQLIKNDLDPSLRRALTMHSASDGYSDVELIRIIVKQLGAYVKLRLTNKTAGALTNVAVTAMTDLCKEVAPDSTVSNQNSKQDGFSCTRTLKCGKKFQVIRSTGKHTNAMIACMEWAKQCIPDFVENRSLHMKINEKLAFFHALQELSKQQIEFYSLEMLRLSPLAVENLSSDQYDQKDDIQASLADLILIALNKNNQYINAIAPNFRASRK